MNPETLDEIKAKLTSEKKRLKGLLKRTHKHIHRSEPLSADFAEQAVEVENDQVVEALDREGKIELRQIKKALKRIDKGTYGICKSCDEVINEARLLAVPETALCIACASKLEQAG